MGKTVDRVHPSFTNAPHIPRSSPPLEGGRLPLPVATPRQTTRPVPRCGCDGGFFLCVCVRLFEAGERGRGGEASLQSCCCCCAIDALGRGHGYWPAAAARVAAASSRSQPAATATTGAGARAYMRVQEGRESSCSSTRTRRRQRSPLLTRRSARRMRSTHASIPLHTHTQHAPAAGFAFPVLGTAPLS